MEGIPCQEHTKQCSKYKYQYVIYFLPYFDKNHAR